MPKSMTGFARVDHSATWGNAVVELKSVNHRFLDLNFRMPDFLRAIEHPLREQIRKQLARGKVDCSISLKFNANQGNSLQLDHDVANAYIAATAELGNILSSVEQLTPSQLLQLPGVLSEQKVDTDTLQKDISNAVTQALKLLNQSRQREGDVLGNEVTQRTQQIRTLNNSLSQIVPAIRQALTDRLRKRLAEFDDAVKAERIELELVMMAQKMDVEEEIDRLNAHLDQIDELIGSQQPIGRKLDFLMQELNREANTLGSKSQGIAQTNVSVEMKVLIEQIREQIQNIE